MSLIKATLNTDIEEVTRLLLENKTNINEVDETGSTALIYVSKNKSHVAHEQNDTVKTKYRNIQHLLLRYGADATIVNNDFEYASFYDKYIPYNITYVSDPNDRLNHINRAISKFCYNRLHFASCIGDEKLAQRALDMNVDIQSSFYYGNALIPAIENRQINTIKFLISKGIDVNFPCPTLENYRYIRTPLAIAILRSGGNNEIIKVLIESKADVNLFSFTDGWSRTYYEMFHTPLHLVCHNRGVFNNNLIKLLLENGADPTIKDINSPDHRVNPRIEVTPLQIILNHWTIYEKYDSKNHNRNTDILIEEFIECICIFMDYDISELFTHHDAYKLAYLLEYLSQ